MIEELSEYVQMREVSHGAIKIEQRSKKSQAFGDTGSVRLNNDEKKEALEFLKQVGNDGGEQPVEVALSVQTINRVYNALEAGARQLRDRPEWDGDADKMEELADEIETLIHNADRPVKVVRDE